MGSNPVGVQQLNQTPLLQKYKLLFNTHTPTYSNILHMYILHKNRAAHTTVSLFPTHNASY